MPPLETTITAVTVYPDRARVTRQGKLTVIAGEQLITIGNLPTNLENDSVRVSGRGAGIKIIGVDVKTAFLTNAPEQEIAALTAQIEDLQAQDAELEDQDRTLSARLDLLMTTRQQAGENLGKMIAYQRATLDDYATFARFASEEQTGLQNQRREVAQQRKELQKQIATLEQQLNQRRNAASRKVEQRREIQVAIQAAEATVFELEAIYSIRGASWTPLYDVRLHENEVELNYLATITQKTGEDWNNVALALSTARTAISSTLPELQPHYIAPPAPPVPRPAPAARMEKRAFAASLIPQADAEEAADELLAMPAPAPLAEVAQATIDVGAGGASVTYRIGTPTTIPGDGNPYKITVVIEKLSAALDYLTVPKIAPEVYLRAKITNTSAYTLLPGQASIYHGEEFVGKTYIQTIAPGEEFEAQLGVDDRVKVRRELVQREVGKRFMGGNRQLQYKYKITLTNLLATDAKITVSDQMPVSRHEQIKVRLLESNIPGKEQTELNILKWEVILKPGEKRDIIFAYSVEHPADMNVLGLE